jgi:hypothetical protein
MGQVFISDERGEQIFWQGHNVITIEMQKRLLTGMVRVSNPPTYCAVGSSYTSTLSDDPWDQFDELEKEIARFRIAGSMVDPLDHRAYLVTTFRQQNANTIWRELGLFDAAEEADYGDHLATSCDALNSDNDDKRWTTGATGTLLADPSQAVDGLAALSLLNAGTGDPVYTNSGVAFRPTSSLKSDLNRTRLQMFLGLSDTASLGAVDGVTVRAYSSDTGEDRWEWQIGVGSLMSGLNHLDLRFSDATQIGSPPSQINIERLQVHAPNRSTGMGFLLDGLRLYRSSGTLLARAEIHPEVKKTSGTKVVTWVIEPFPEI